jgi:hypothetical protein
MAGVSSRSRTKKRPTPREKMEAARPSLAKLKQLARSSRPPQSWYGETDNPFNAPRKKK